MKCYLFSLMRYLHAILIFIIMQLVKRNKLHVPKCKLAVTQKYVAYQGVILWNNMYNTIDINCSIVTFKRKLRNYLLHNDV